MMYLHENKQLFEEVISSTSELLNKPEQVVEKDYYVTMILKALSSKTDCVFKGGTSLSKCHHAIDRFSEDIDITFSNKLTAGQRKSLKNNIIASVSEELKMPIIDWNKSRSRRDFNCYTFEYEPLDQYDSEKMNPSVRMEVSLSSLSFPTERIPVDSYVRQFLEKDNANLIDKYGLELFSMNVQSIDRTFIDKVFALCDYHMEKQYEKHSRHIYDLYMLLPRIKFDDKFKNLIEEVRNIRSELEICPSAKQGSNVSAMLKEIIDLGAYKEDYIKITTYFENHPLSYEEAIKAVFKISELNLF